MQSATSGRAIRNRATWLSLLCALSAVLLLGIFLTAGANAAPVVGPSGDSFYMPPSPLPGAASGDLIWYRPAKLQLYSNIGVKAWTVLYRSQSATGAPVAVSGTVIVPTAPWTGSGRRPVVSDAM